MGRCNNRRTQQAAQSLRNTPARARFSAPPPHIRRKAAGGRVGGGRSGGGSQQQQQQQRTQRTPQSNNNNNNKASVIAKISQRVQAESALLLSNNYHTTTTHSSILHGVADLSQLEQLTLSESSLRIIDKLLQDLGVISSTNKMNDTSLPQQQQQYHSSTPDDDEEERLQQFDNYLNMEDQDDNEGNDEYNDEDFLPDVASDVDGLDVIAADENTATTTTSTCSTAAAAATKQTAMIVAATSSRYEEYEQDNEDDYYLPETTTTTTTTTTTRTSCSSNTIVAITGGGGGGIAADDTEWLATTSTTKTNNNQNTARATITTTADIVKKWQSDPVFYHLTQKLSFPPIVAARACQAVEHWPAAAAAEGGESDAKTSQQQQQQQASRLVHVMDWMCLHLLENDLKLGFQRNPAYQPSSGNNKQNSSTITSSSSSSSSSNSILLAGTGRTKPIPHPSISVAVKLTEDREWSRMTRLEERAVGFLPFGFLHGEILQVLLQQQQEQSSEDANSKKDDDVAGAIQNSRILRRLLTVLEEQVLSSKTAEKESSTAINEEDVRRERDMEKEALVAIYDTEFEAHEDDGSGLGQYKISMNIESCPGNDTELFVFLRPNYPGTEYPLFLINNPSLPWPFLRQMNSEIIALVREIGLGVPLIFEVTSYVTDTLPELLNEFHKVEKAKDFERTQLRLRQEAGHSIEDDLSLNYDDGVKVGRRQRSRVKAAEVAFDSDKEVQQRAEEKKRRQEKRIEKIRDESRFIRQSMADRVIEQREIEKHKEGIRKAGRSAMNTAFNRGASADEAREAARRAEAAYRKDHGLVDSGNGEMQQTDESMAAGEGGPPEQKQDTLREEGDTPVSGGATPTTAAFMERLRNMYTVAANERQQLTLCEPNDAGDGEESKTKLPQPVPPLTGEFSEMAEDIISIQNEQPWLVSREARVPTRANQGASPPVLDGASRQNEINQQLKKRFNLKTTQKLDKIQEQRRRLPAYSMREAITKAIRENQITLIRGETGCGKTTQCPQLVLADMISSNKGSEANIIVTQPRRISAIGVAERIAAELGEKVGATCGYSIKLEKKYSKDTRVLLCTTGILLRRLQVDPDLAAVSHVFVDEVHERDLLTDFLLIVLKKLVKRRKYLRLILMSATVSAETFADYFSSYGCAQVEIPGRAFPVEEYRLEDILQQTGYEVQEGSEYTLKPSTGSESGRMSKSALRKLYYPKYDSKVIHSLSIIDESILNYELLAELLEHIVNTTEDGAILVFLPGMMEIIKAIDEMRRKEVFQTNRVVIYPLHSTLSTSEQSKVFNVPPVGVRKIIVSTNIAETSITIEDVVYVVDSGRVKENRRDEIKESPALVDCWVSRSSAKQRRGRAGRVRQGISFHFFSSHTHDNNLAEYILPEMLRVGVEELTLQILVLDLGEPHIFLGQAIDPPSGLAMKNALSLLEELGAIECTWHSQDWNVEKCSDLDVSVELTALGFHLATLPVEPRVGKIMIYGAILGCVEASLTLAASMSAKKLFLSSFDKRDATDEARRGISLDNSDMLTISAVFNDFQEIRAKKGNRCAQQFTKEHFLNPSALFQIVELRKQYSRLLIDIGFLPKDFALSKFQDFRSQDRSLIKAVLCAGLYPNIVVAPKKLLLDGVSSKQKISEIPFQSRRRGEVFLHPCTLLNSTELPLENRYFCFYEIVKTSKLYIRDCTAVTPFSLLLFGGKLKLYHEQGVVSMDDWLKFRIAAQPATFVKHLRKHLESMLLSKIISPNNEHDVEGRHTQTLIQAAVKIVLEDEKPVSQTDSIGPQNVDSDHEDMKSRQARTGRGGGRSRGSLGAGRGRGGRKERK